MTPTLTTWLAVFLGGGLGSVLRFAVGQGLASILSPSDTAFPWAVLAANVLAFATSQLACVFVYPMLTAWLITRQVFPDWYLGPDCLGREAGFLYAPSLAVHESLWWLVLGILSSIGLGTGLHSGLMFLWPFVMSVSALVPRRMTGEENVFRLCAC